MFWWRRFQDAKETRKKLRKSPNNVSSCAILSWNRDFLKNIFWNMIQKPSKFIAVRILPKQILPTLVVAVQFAQWAEHFKTIATSFRKRATTTTRCGHFFSLNGRFQVLVVTNVHRYVELLINQNLNFDTETSLDYWSSIIEHQFFYCCKKNHECFKIYCEATTWIIKSVFRWN